VSITRDLGPESENFRLARWWLLGHALYGRSDVATERFESAAHGGDRCFVILPSCGGAEACFAHHQLLLVCCCNTPARHQHCLAPQCPIKLGHLDNDLVVNRRRPRPGMEHHPVRRDQERQVLRQHAGHGVLQRRRPLIKLRQVELRPAGPGDNLRPVQIGGRVTGPTPMVRSCLPVEVGGDASARVGNT
jgi:hypothetical protein